MTKHVALIAVNEHWLILAQWKVSNFIRCGLPWSFDQQTDNVALLIKLAFSGDEDVWITQFMNKLLYEYGMD